MVDTFLIASGTELPSEENVLAILETYKRVEIQYEDLPNKYVYNLTYSLANKAVYDSKWNKTIFISPCIHNDKIW
jgi:hypothetical protein